MSTKTPKRSASSWREEFEQVREFLLSHRLGSEHPAIAAAVQGVDQELKRRERDQKLQKKFSASSGVSADDEGFSKIGKEPFVQQPDNLDEKGSPSMKDDSMTDDWQDVSQDRHVVEGEPESTKSSLGAELAKASVAALGQNGVTCSTAAGALAVALHATLLQVGFVCTGIPTESSSTNGFAAPVRQISTFLPPRWENGEGIRLRYRKKHAVTMKVSCVSDKRLEIVMGENSMVVDTADHLNLTSWAKAMKPSPPSLHYKSLGELLTSFTNHFDLGLMDEQKASFSTPIDAKAPPSISESYLLHDGNRPAPYNNDPLRVQRFPSHPANFPGQQQPYGDFSGDLTPAGLMNPFSQHPAGNLMGPGHPMFSGQSNGGSMKPRFDPFGPPGGPMGDDPKNGGGGTGNPNNDLAMPPRLDPNNMFM